MVSEEERSRGAVSFMVSYARRLKFVRLEDAMKTERLGKPKMRGNPA